MRKLDPEAHRRQKEKILMGALRLFSSKSFSQASMAMIAQRCAVQKATLYHYFSSKQAILRELVHWRWQKIRQRIARLPIGKDLEETLYSIGMDFLTDTDKKENQDFMVLLYRDGFGNPLLKKVFLTIFKSKFQEMRNDCGRFFGRKTFVSDKVQIMFMHQFMACLLRFALETRLWNAGTATLFSDEEYVRGLARTFSKGIQS